jgi:hypothetical protein
MEMQEGMRSNGKCKYVSRYVTSGPRPSEKILRKEKKED